MRAWANCWESAGLSKESPVFEGTEADAEAYRRWCRLCGSSGGGSVSLLPVTDGG